MMKERYGEDALPGKPGGPAEEENKEDDPHERNACTPLSGQKAWALPGPCMTPHLRPTGIVPCTFELVAKVAQALGDVKPWANQMVSERTGAIRFA